MFTNELTETSLFFGEKTGEIVNITMLSPGDDDEDIEAEDDDWTDIDDEDFEDMAEDQDDLSQIELDDNIFDPDDDDHLPDDDF